MMFLRTLWASSKVRKAVIVLIAAILAAAFGLPPEVLDPILSAFGQ